MDDSELQYLPEEEKKILEAYNNNNITDDVTNATYNGPKLFSIFGPPDNNTETLSQNSTSLANSTVSLAKNSTTV